MKPYSRHAHAADEIYCTMMAELTGEHPDNYRGRPFDMDLLTFAPSAPEERPRPRGWNFPYANDGPRHSWPPPPDHPPTYQPDLNKGW